jgi:hypothetical protein
VVETQLANYSRAWEPTNWPNGEPNQALLAAQASLRLVRLRQQLLRSKDGNGNCPYRDSDVEFAVSVGCLDGALDHYFRVSLLSLAVVDRSASSRTCQLSSFQEAIRYMGLTFHESGSLLRSETSLCLALLDVWNLLLVMQPLS